MAGISKSTIRNLISWYFSWRLPILIILITVGVVLMVAGLVLFKYQLSAPTMRSKLVPAVSTEIVVSTPASAPIAISEAPIPEETPTLKKVDTKSDHQGKSYQVQPGDTLWDIAEAQYGDPLLWPSLYAANQSTIGGNPDLILPGQVLLL